MKEIETDGFITREEDLMKSERTAKPFTECKYPKCEECDKYIDGYCTVPMVVSKQIYHYVQDEMAKMQNDIAELQKFVIDEILGVHNTRVERKDQ